MPALLELLRQLVVPDLQLAVLELQLVLLQSQSLQPLGELILLLSQLVFLLPEPVLFSSQLVFLPPHLLSLLSHSCVLLQQLGFLPHSFAVRQLLQLHDHGFQDVVQRQVCTVC